MYPNSIGCNVYGISASSKKIEIFHPFGVCEVKSSIPLLVQNSSLDIVLVDCCFENEMYENATVDEIIAET